MSDTKTTAQATQAGKSSVAKSAVDAAAAAKAKLLEVAAKNNSANTEAIEKLAEAAPVSTPKTKKERDPNERSAKAKSSLGIPEENIITWIPFHSDPTTNKMLNNAAKHRDVKVAMMLVNILRDAITGDVLESLKKDADDYETSRPVPGAKGKRIDEMSEDEVAAELKKQEDKIARLQAQLQAAKARMTSSAS